MCWACATTAVAAMMTNDNKCNDLDSGCSDGDGKGGDDDDGGNGIGDSGNDGEDDSGDSGGKFASITKSHL